MGIFSKAYTKDDAEGVMKGVARNLKSLAKDPTKATPAYLKKLASVLEVNADMLEAGKYL